MEPIIEYVDGKEIKVPQIVYKYRAWNISYHKKILNEGTLYFAAPNEFEDEKDCNVPEEFPSEKELYEFFLDDSKNKHPYQNRAFHRKEARTQTKKSPLMNPNQKRKMIEEFHSEFNDRFGVLSLTLDCKNDKMWEKYADNHSGVCYGFDTKLLYECIKGIYGEIIYVDTLPSINFLKDNFKTKASKNIFYKERKWEFEKEYRIAHMWENTASATERNVQFSPNCLVEIRLGKFMPQEAQYEIKQIASQKYPNANIIECC